MHIYMCVCVHTCVCMCTCMENECVGNEFWSPARAVCILNISPVPSVYHLKGISLTPPKPCWITDLNMYLSKSLNSSFVSPMLRIFI